MRNNIPAAEFGKRDFRSEKKEADDKLVADDFQRLRRLRRLTGAIFRQKTRRKSSHFHHNRSNLCWAKKKTKTTSARVKETNKEKWNEKDTCISEFTKPNTYQSSFLDFISFAHTTNSDEKGVHVEIGSVDEN
ncbi:hypothetical protein YC2023_076723 [Brassica napus]